LRPTALKPLDKDAPTQWMIEARDVSLHEVYEPLQGFSCNTKLPAPLKLDTTYQARSIPVVRQQIERAGLRLAQLLNELLAAP
jgi:S1/P1 Nuclease